MTHEPCLSPPEFLTEDEVCARYRGTVSPGTLRNWRSQKRGPAYVKIGKIVLYPRAAIEAWEAANTVGGLAAADG